MDKISQLEEKIKKVTHNHKDELEQTRQKQLAEIRGLIERNHWICNQWLYLDMNDQNYENLNKKDAEIMRLTEKIKEYNHFLVSS